MIDIYVISLERAEKRRKHVQKHYQSFSQNLYIIDAIDARNFTNEELYSLVDADRRKWTNYLRPGAICCALSHMKAYEKFLSSSNSHCLILEDDANLNSSKTELENIIHSIIKSNFDIVCLNSFNPEKTTLEKYSSIDKKYKTYKSNNSKAPGSGLAYIVNRKAALSIIKYNSPVKDAADAWDSFANELDINIGYIKPDVFSPKNFESTIDYTRSSFIKSLIPSFIRNIRRSLINRRMKKNVLFK